MPIVVPNASLQAFGYWLFAHGGAGMPDLQLSLFSNDLTPDADTTFGDFVESAFTGYSPEPMPNGDWAIGIQPPDSALATFNEEFQWTSGSDSGMVYGYYVYQPGADNLAWCQRFDSPVPLEIGTVIKVRPKLGLWSRYLPPGP